MGIFDVFKKKDCEICGKEVGVFGYKKLEDGEICKDCVKLLSPWFDDRRHSTVELIKAQIAAREQNKIALEGFSHSRCFGLGYRKIYIEEKNGIPTRFVISEKEDYRSENADIIAFFQVSSYEIDIDDSKNEEKYTNDKGERVSYNPPRYTYNYDFNLKLTIAGIYYIDDMRMKLNSSTLHLETIEHRGVLGGIGGASFDPMLYPEYREYKAMCDELLEIFSCGQRGVRVPVGDDVIQSLLDQIANAPDKEAMNEAREKLIKLTFDHPDRESIRDRGVEAMMRFDFKQSGIKPPADLSVKAPTPVQRSKWKCFCGTENTGRFCNECGTKQFSVDEIECSECSWTAEGEEIPSECPNCGKVFGSEDIR